MFKSIAKHLDSVITNKQSNNKLLYLADVDTSVLWNLYLDSFPEGTNKIHITNREYDCNCCKTFIKNVGAVVSIDNNFNVNTIWDDYEKLHYPFNVVFEKLSMFVKNAKIKSVYVSKFENYGHEFTLSNDNLRYDHFYCTIDNYHYSSDFRKFMGESINSYNVFKRGLTELKDYALTDVKYLIDNNDLYRGAEFKNKLVAFIDLKNEYNKLSSSKQDNFIWKNINHKSALIKNTLLGKLLEDLSLDMPLDRAVSAYEAMAGNMNRTTAPISQSMINRAIDEVKQLGYTNSLERRQATLNDLTLPNVLWVDHKKSNTMKDSNVTNAFNSLSTVSKKKIDTKDKMSVDEFIKTIIPNTKVLEYYFENPDNLVALTTEKIKESKSMFKWSNPFAWSYISGTTDVIKERVKKAGGKIEGALRVSLSWGNYDDLDIHARTPAPNTEHIYFGNKSSRYEKLKVLDVDKNAACSETREPVENMVFNNLKDGTYNFTVHNYRKRENSDEGFTLQVAYGNVEMNLVYDRAVLDNATVDCIDVIIEKGNVKNVIVNNKNLIKSTNSNKEVWNLKLNNFVSVDCFMLSPNYWDDNKVGNKHYMFMLNDAKVNTKLLGFYNEFLNNDLYTHRKVFEQLSHKLECEVDENKGLAGVGFSSTLNKVALFKADGRLVKVLFN